MDTADRYLSDLRCPACGESLTCREEAVQCTACSSTVPVRDGVFHFPVTAEETATPRVFDLLASMYETPLWFPALYRLAGGPRAPVDDRPKVVETLRPVGDSVLDVACGTGRLTRYVAPEAAVVWGIDISEGMLRRARRSAVRRGTDNVAFARMPADDLRFDRGIFDSVACCWALHLFSDVPGVLDEMSRVLAGDGRIAGTTLVDEYVLAVPGMRAGLRQTLGGTAFEREQVRALLRDAGFSAVECERYGAALFFSAQK